MKNIALLVSITLPLLCINSVVLGNTQKSPILTKAKALGKKCSKLQWGDAKKDKTKINCTQFVIKVIKAVAEDQGKESKITKKIQEQIAIDTIKEGEDLQSLVDKVDDRIKGVQYALSKSDPSLGTIVAIKDARVGDLIQYWYKDKDKIWQGHTGIIEKIEKGKDKNGKEIINATIYGSHRTTLQRESKLDIKNRKGGVGSGPVLDLTDNKNKIFIVRWVSPSNKLFTHCDL